MNPDALDDGRSRGKETSAVRSASPTVLILTPLKDGTSFLDAYFAGLEKLTYPALAISLGFLESDSGDSTFDRIQERAFAAALRQRRNLAEELRFSDS